MFILQLLISFILCCFKFLMIVLYFFILSCFLFKFYLYIIISNYEKVDLRSRDTVIIILLLDSVEFLNFALKIILAI